MNLIPESHKDLLEDENKAFAFLATTMSDGSPQVSPVWFNYDGKLFWINSVKGRLKERNILARPEVAFTIMKLDEPYRYLLVQGKVVEVTQEGAEAHIHALSHKHMGKDWDIPEGQVRVIFKIEADRVHES